MGTPVVTVIDAVIDPAQEAELIDGFRALSNDDRPDELQRSELLRGQEGAWRIQTTWRDFEALMAVRKRGKPPAAMVLLDSLGAEHSHTWFTVEVSVD